LKYILFISSILLIAAITSCSNSIEEVDALFTEKDLKIEQAKDVEILYSDSAQIKLKIMAPTLKRYVEKKKSIDEFPDGVLVEFYDNNGNIISWLQSDYAIRKDEDKRIYVKQNVKLFNTDEDELNTDELIWNEETGEIYTNKYVRITQPRRGDTLFGYGFIAKQEFQRFQLNKKVSGTKFLELDKMLNNCLIIRQIQVTLNDNI